MPTTTHFRTKSIGTLAILKPLADKCKIKELIDSIVPKLNYKDITHGDVFEILVINRLHSPKPLYDMEYWASELMALSELYDIDPKRLNDDTIAETLDRISEHIDEIQTAIGLQVIKTFDIPLEAVFYDITSLYFEGELEESDIVRYGYSRDQKPDRKQINIGLNTSSVDAIPINYNVYPGNTADIETVEQNMKRLRESLNVKDLIIVGDRSSISKDIARKIDDDGFKFISAIKLSVVRNFLLRFDRSSLRDYSIQGYRIADTTFNFGRDFRAIVVLSEKLVETKRKTRAKALKRLEEKLSALKSKIGKRGYKKRDHVIEAIGAIKREFKHVARFMNIELSQDNSMSYDLNKAALDEAEKIDGFYVILTNIYDRPAEEILTLYKGNYKIEDRFRTLKKDVKVRPIFLHKDNRILALVLVTIVALILYSLIELICKRNGIKITARMVFRLFEKLNVVIIINKKRIVRVEDPPPYQQEFLKLFGIRDVQTLLA